MPAVLAVLAAALLFGTTGTSQALGPDGTTPFAVGALRLAVGGTALALVTAIAASARRRRTPATARPRATRGALGLMALAAVSLFVYQPLFFLGTAVNGVAVSTVIALGSAPVLAGLAEWALTRRRPSGTWIGATALSTAGVALLAFGGGATGRMDPLGIAAAIGAGASFASLAVAQRRLLEAGWHPLTVVGAMGAGSGALAIVSLPFLDLAWLGSPRGAAMALWLGLATVTVAYGLFTWGLGGLQAATAATLTLGEPLTATVLGILVLGERLAPLGVAGLVVLVAGLALLAWGSRPRRDPAPFAVEG